VACLTLGGLSAAVVAVGFAFYHGGGRTLAFIAFALVSVPTLLLAFLISMQAGPYPLVFTASSLACLGGYGVVRAKRHPVEPGTPRRQQQQPSSLDPTFKPVKPEDVVGSWQFYFDGASKTVQLDFRPDGTYAQTIVDNRNGVTACPGGTWKLSGPTVELSGYVTLDGETATSLGWWMVDAPLGPILCGGDDAESAVVWNSR